MAEPTGPSVILLGSKPGACVALEVLHENGFCVHAVVACEGDAHPWFGGPTLRVVARELGLPMFDHQDDVPHGDVDLVISYMFRNRVAAPMLARARLAAVNFHAAPLPEYGGYAFYNVAILENATEYGCTCHHMDAGFDTGPLLEVRRFPIDAAQETAQSLEQKSQLVMLDLFEDFCDRVARGEPLPAMAQDPTRRRYLSRQQFEQLKEVPEGADAVTCDRAARAFWFPPYPGAHLRHGERTVELQPAPALRTAPIPYAETLRRLRAGRRQHERC